MEIAVIAHDGKKAEMVQFLMEHKSILINKKITLVSTGTTGTKAEKAGFIVEKVLSGPLGGDAQIAARIVEGKTNMVFFFRDPPKVDRIFKLGSIEITCQHFKIVVSGLRAELKEVCLVQEDLNIGFQLKIVHER